MPKLAPDANPYQQLPCLEVGGVQIYGYFDEGRLIVSLHYDTADPEVQAEDGEVPTEVHGGAGEVVWSA